MRLKIRIWTGTILIGLLCPHPFSTALAYEDAIISIVNDDIITLKDLKDYAGVVYKQLVIEGRSERQIEQVMRSLEENGIEKLIEDKLILSAASKMGLEVRPEVVEERMEEVRNKYSSEQHFLDALCANGSTITDLRDKIEEQFKIQYMVDMDVKSKIIVNPQEVTDYYDAHQDEFQKPERVRLDSIFIPYGENKDRAGEKAQEALKRVGEGQAFEKVAQEYSSAPSIGMIGKGQMMPAIEDTVFQLEEKAVSPPVETETGIYIFNVLEKLPAETATLDEVKEQISQTLFQEKFKERFREWIAKLKKDAYIEIK